MTTIALAAATHDRAFASQALEGMLARARVLDPGPREVRHLAGASLGSLPFAFTARNGSHAHVAEAAGGYAIAFAGVLDNRRELAAELCESAAAASASDAALALAGYRRWGRELPTRLVGDFAFAVWDPAARGAFCARDHLGVRSLFYASRSDRFLAASSVRQLVTEPGEPLDEDFFADYLSWGFPVSGSTPYRQVRRLPAAHALWWDAAGIRVFRYWDPLSLPMLTYRDHASYVEEFRSRFYDAVRAAVGAPGGVVAELSGGLDSSSIVSVLGQLARSREVESSRVSTVTVTYDQAHHSDERDWCAPVIDGYGFGADFVSGDDRFLKSLDSSAQYWDEPSGQMIFFSLYREYEGVLRARGASLLLSGAGAETSVLSEAPEPIHLADLLLRMRLATFAREFSAWRRAKNLPLVNMAARGVLLPLLIPSRRSFFSASNIDKRVAEWIADDFAKRNDLATRVRGRWSDCRSVSRARSFQFEKVWRISGFMFRGYLEKLVRIRYPFLHKPLVEFMLRVPFEHKVRPGLHKALLRDAMTGVLPERIRTRMDKRGPGHAFYLAIEREWPKLEPLLRDPMVAKVGLIDRDKLYRTVQLARLGHCSDSVLLGSTIALEFWLRHTLDAPAAGEST